MRKIIFSLGIGLAALLFSGCQLLDYKAKSGLQVITDDVPSSVFLDGQYLNTTPLIEKEVQPGQYTLRIEPNNQSLLPYETNITLHKGLLTVVTWKPGTKEELSGGVMYEMEPLKNRLQTAVSVVSTPAGAIVSLEGKDKDFTPALYSDVQPGNRAFEITLPSYETQSHTINVQKGYRMLIQVKLAKLQPIERTPTPVASASAKTNDMEASGSALVATPSAKPTTKLSQ
ncbi:MAG: hypothetical protein COY81_03750 [Candidatus Pacebacteria bacterium CG_4_10_14_0_8_um_filter_43_12]|nr:MAG: hypothetical protein COU66_00700 [Candidatus Pacebacteria bacterium CG10_big_fil_rev_8_21_14_0_10_44_11]PIY79198.1 MAG: hypothetical protein COY81_03750 [Candidatus Pacebacteria bacterium CG_4_10_14_0_8_um_filter_43_12]